MCALIGWLLFTQPLLFITMVLCILFLREHFPSSKLSIPQHVMAVMVCGFIFGTLLGSVVAGFTWDLPYTTILKIIVQNFLR